MIIEPRRFLRFPGFLRRLFIHLPHLAPNRRANPQPPFCIYIARYNIAPHPNTKVGACVRIIRTGLFRDTRPFVGCSAVHPGAIPPLFQARTMVRTRASFAASGHNSLFPKKYNRRSFFKSSLVSSQERIYRRGQARVLCCLHFLHHVSHSGAVLLRAHRRISRGVRCNT